MSEAGEAENHARDALMAALAEVGLPTADPATTTERIRHGIVFHNWGERGWPFRLDIPVEYQDWILVAACIFIVSVWCLPCYCGRLSNRCSKAFTRAIYTQMHMFYCFIMYFTLIVVMVVVGILPDWTVNEFLRYLGDFIGWVLQHMQKLLTCVFIMIAFAVALKFRDRVLLASGIEHITFFRFSFMDLFGLGRKRPVEIFIWKCDGLQSSSGKMLKANDVYVECHMGYNETMRTRVHNNAGNGCIIQESFQINIDEAAAGTLMTILVKDQTLLASAELGRLMLSTRELCGIEDQTGKRRVQIEYSEACFVPLDLAPRGRVWIAIAPVDDVDDPEEARLVNDDDLMIC